MIKVEHVTKIYKSQKAKCLALDDVSFELPDSGMIFIVGKSGSGKSTLLNLLGCLDTPTSGDIIENGKSLAHLKLSEQTYYRNSTIGFIFQDFHLINTLTIFENIMFSLQLHGEENKEKVLKLLKDTDIEECANRYPKQLSGGQQQRVAIARALIKNPSIILADEPTGNLDSKTSLQILNLLKTLSKDKLVVVISHNLKDAYSFADEIIELAEGKILQHIKRNEQFNPLLRVEDDTLILPRGQEFSDENINEVSELIKNKKINKVKQDKSQFAPYNEPLTATEQTPTPLEKKHLKLNGTSKIAVKFARHSWVKMILYSVLIAVLMSVLGLSQLIMTFSSGDVLAREMDKRNLSCSSFIKNTNDNYESIDSYRLVDIEDDDIQKFYDAGYDGKIYPLVNCRLYLMGADNTVTTKRTSANINPYDVSCTAGVLITEPSYLEQVFGKLEYTALSSTPRDYGIYITDFYADACLINWPYAITYNSLLGTYRRFQIHNYAYVNGIINTGYKERYKNLLDKLKNPQLSKEEQNALIQSDEGLAFYDELCQYLTIAYTFDSNFVDDIIDSRIRQYCGFGNSVFEYNGKEYEYTNYFQFSNMNVDNNVVLKDNEMIMPYTMYNYIFGTTYSTQTINEFIPHEVTLTYYLKCDENRSYKKYEVTLNIIKLNKSIYYHCNVADNVFKELQRVDMFTYGLYLSEVNQASTMYNVADSNNFLPNSSIASVLVNMANVVKVFSAFFNLIFTILCLCIFAILVQFGVKNIKDNMKEIGIIKALGGRNIDLMLIFGLQTVIVGVLMVLFYMGTSFLFVTIANKILVLSLSHLAKKVVIADLSFLVVKWKFILQNCLLALVIMAISFIIPMIRLRKIKPTKVIKAND